MKTARFPKDFLWGTATASYQVEGAHNEDGKGESIWDRFSHEEGRIINGDHGDVACDQYHRYREDVAIMKSLNHNAHRFSIAWSRVIPDGKGAVNQKGLDYYSRFVDEMLANGIEPMPTLYHWDLPQALQDEGGWANRDIIEHFSRYAEVMVNALGDRVNKWMVFNEAASFTHLAYFTGTHAPGIRDPRLAMLTSHMVNVTQGRAMRAMRATGKCRSVGSAYIMSAVYPASDSPEDAAAAERLHGFSNDWFLRPVMRGEYPKCYIDQERIIERMDIRPGDMESMKEDLDFIGINLYFRDIVADAPGDRNLGVLRLPLPEPKTAFPASIWPASIYRVIMRVHRDYGKPMYVTENGCSYPDGPGADGRVRDEKRTDYLRGYISQVLRAREEGADVRGYLLWSLMDNFEWAFGYSQRFGIVHVDFETLKRTVKDSGYWYRDMIASGQLDYDETLE